MIATPNLGRACTRPSRTLPTTARVLDFIRSHKHVPRRDLFDEFHVRNPGHLSDILNKLLRQGLIQTDSTGTTLFPKRTT